MKCLLLTADGDIDTSGHGLTLVDGGRRVAQQVQTALRVFLGEWDFDLDQGIPWLQRILARKDVNLTDVENILREKILAVADVKSITAWAMTWDTQARKLTINAKLDTAFGPVGVEGVFP